MPTPLAIYGAGGFGRQVAWIVQDHDEALELVAFVDDGMTDADGVVNGVPVRRLEALRESHPQLRVFVAVSSPRERCRLVETLKEGGFTFANVLSRHALRSRWLELGTGIVLCAGTVIDPNVTIGNHVHVNKDCTIGHDTVIGDFVTLAPGSHIGGHVHLRAGVFVGMGAVILQGTSDQPLIVGENALIGAGACVTKSVAPGITVVGVPAKPIASPQLSRDSLFLLRAASTD